MTREQAFKAVSTIFLVALDERQAALGIPFPPEAPRQLLPDGAALGRFASLLVAHICHEIEKLEDHLLEGEEPEAPET